jgi:tetratricopeptide (TPR) repeat protein
MFTRIIILFVVQLVTISVAYAQKEGQARIDSLLSVLPNAKEDTGKVRLFNSISSTYHLIDPNKGISYGEQGIDLANKLKWEKGLGMLYNTLGNNYRIKGDYSIALEYFFKALKVNEKINERIGIAQNFGNIGIIYKTQKDYPNALVYYNKALAMFEKLGNKEGIGTNLGNIGITYEMMKEYSKSLDYQKRALKIYEETGNRKSIAHNLANIGLVYDDMGEYPTALEYQFKALAINEELAIKRSIVNNCLNIGTIYYHIAADTDRVVKNAEKNAALANAIKYLDKSLHISQQIGAVGKLQEIHDMYARVYELSGNYKKAFDNYRQSVAIRDSVFSKEKSEAITRLQVRHEYEKKNLADSLKHAEIVHLTTLQLQKQRYYTYSLVAGIVILIMLAYIVVNKQNQKHKHNEQRLSNEKQHAETELNHATAQLSTFTNSISEKNELLEKFTAELARLRKEYAIDNAEENELHLKLQQSVIMTDEQWANFYRIFERVHKGFSERLKEKIPGLSPVETRFFMLARLRFSEKEMATIQGISTDAAKMNVNRLRNKLDLAKQSSSLEDFANTI